MQHYSEYTDWKWEEDSSLLPNQTNDGTEAEVEARKCYQRMVMARISRKEQHSFDAAEAEVVNVEEVMAAAPGVREVAQHYIGSEIQVYP